MFVVTRYVMWFAPIGVFAAIGATVGGRGLAVLLTLGRLVVLMYVGLVLFVLIGGEFDSSISRHFGAIAH